MDTFDHHRVADHVQVNILSLGEAGEVTNGEVARQDALVTNTNTSPIVAKAIRFGCFNMRGKGTSSDDITVFTVMKQHTHLDIIALQELRWVESHVVWWLKIGDNWGYCGNKEVGVLFRTDKFTANQLNYEVLHDEETTPELRKHVVCVVLTGRHHDPLYELFVASVHAPYNGVVETKRLQNVSNILCYVSAMALEHENSSAQNLPALPIIVGGDFNINFGPNRDEIVPDGWVHIDYNASPRRAESRLGPIDHALIRSNVHTWPTMHIDNCVQLNLVDVIKNIPELGQQDRPKVNVATMTNHDPIAADVNFNFKLCAIDNCSGLGRVAGYQLQCEECKKLSCAECFTVCIRCNDSSFCPECLQTEVQCGARVCNECWWSCGHCDDFGTKSIFFCNNGGECGCISRVSCSICKEVLCDACRKQCDDCTEWFCADCYENDECGEDDSDHSESVQEQVESDCSESAEGQEEIGDVDEEEDDEYEQLLDDMGYLGLE